MGPGVLSKVLAHIPKAYDENLLIGFDSADDAAVYKVSEDMALIQTLDFFTPIVEDPYTYGKIAAANSLSDVYAMGGDVLTALNIVCFPEKLDPNILGEILRGGAEKVMESGGILSGGHSVNDENPKYGLSVTGVVHPDKVIANNTCKAGDKLILTKPLGIGIVTTAHNVGEANDRSYKEAIKLMETLNKYSAEKMKKYEINGCTDVTGFGFLGHLSEMLNDEISIIVDSKKVPYIKEAYEYAEEFLITSAGQKNRKHLGDKVVLEGVPFPMEEILFDPQTSGGLLISVANEDADKLLADLEELDIKSSLVGEVVSKSTYRMKVI
ncbi:MULTISPECIES: selenide, water dikinase SelD [Psychrilyobacter]|uniref:selenide, water dikinase SelD n=1 Tax=Psychrilyobacter TaxID=623282 RepID=UPI002100B0AD|nr:MULTISPECIES: selenide, water dikinase SelD [Psychrilyobacter]MCS5421124.1 selenide, water dikinase SelD [Psychrilyobacter sp. S5]